MALLAHLQNRGLEDCFEAADCGVNSFQGLIMVTFQLVLDLAEKWLHI